MLPSMSGSGMAANIPKRPGKSRAICAPNSLQSRAQEKIFCRGGRAAPARFHMPLPLPPSLGQGAQVKCNHVPSRAKSLILLEMQRRDRVG
jgi:hypothetical protein